MSVRLDIVIGLVLALVVANGLYRRRQAQAGSDARPVPKLPADVVGDTPSTWVVFTTKYCATCEPVCRRLQAAQPGATVVKVDAADRPELARAFRIQRAPTALLADAGGTVTARLVGPEAVEGYLRAGVFAGQ